MFLPSTPLIPLARRVKMPDGHPFETGALSFQLTALQLHGASAVELDVDQWDGVEDRQSLRFRICNLRLEGGHAVMVKPDPMLTVDSGGNLMELPEEARQPMKGGSTTVANSPLEPEKEEWVTNARSQRVRLASSPGGQALLGTFSEHNAVYEEVFKIESIITSWQANGVTKEMAADTHDATNDRANGKVVNPKDRLYGNEITYNGNAFIQQFNISLGCLLADPNFDDERLPDPDSRYTKASEAALAFGKGIGESTDNSKDTVNEMNSNQVHAAVANHSGEAPVVTRGELLQLVRDTPPGGRGSEEVQGWLRLDEEDRARLRELRLAVLSERAEKASIVGKPLFEGSCSALIGDADVLVEFSGEANGIASRVEITLPAFDLDIDDSGWIGDAGEVARDRIERIYFIRSLLHNAIADQLRKHIPHTVRRILAAEIA
jgi:hypothetical protein